MYFSRELILSVLAATAFDQASAAPVDKEVKGGTIATSGIPTVPSFPAGSENSSNPTPQVGSSKSNSIQVSEDGQSVNANQISSDGINSIQETPAGINVNQISGNGVDSQGAQNFAASSNSTEFSPSNAAISQPSVSHENGTRTPLAKVAAANGVQGGALGIPNDWATPGNARFSAQTPTSSSLATQSAQSSLA